MMQKPGKKDGNETRRKNQERYLAQLPSPEKTDLNSNRLGRRSKNFCTPHLGLAGGFLSSGRERAFFCNCILIF